MGRLKAKTQGHITHSVSQNVIDRRSMERDLAGIREFVEAGNFKDLNETNAALKKYMAEKNAGGNPAGAVSPEDKPPLRRAQDLIWDAFEIQGARRVQLARQALQISPDCADAYVILAEETAVNSEERLKLYAQGVDAGRRALGSDYFQEHAGDFWGMTETRPFMRAMEGFAVTKWEMGNVAEGIELVEAMLKLNPGDNQGMRYSLACMYVQNNQDQKAIEFMKKFPDDTFCGWPYTKALIAFRKHGITPAAQKGLAAALKSNPWVREYLTRKQPVPEPNMSGYTTGSPEEAEIYFRMAHVSWRMIPGAVEWLAREGKQG